MILQVNCIREKPRVLRKMFRKSTVTSTLLQDYRKNLRVRYFVNRAPGSPRTSTLKIYNGSGGGYLKCKQHTASIGV